MPERALKIGDLGEIKLKEWCTQRNLKAHPPNPDRSGWDFFLEIPVAEEEESIFTPPLVGPVMMNCFVQVKATDGRRGRIDDIKLRQWKNLATSMLPAFFLILEFDGKDEPCRGYLVHLDEGYRERFLKAHFKATSVKTKEDPEDNPKLPLCYSENEELLPLNGAGFEKAVRDYIGDPEEYSKKKLASLKSAGFENGIGRLDFRVSRDSLEGMSLQQYLIDTSIGIQRGPLTVELVKFSPVRFGITSPNPITLPGGLGLLSTSPSESAGATAVRFLSTPPLTLDMETFLPQGALVADNQDKLKIRLAAPFIELICTWESGKKALLNISLPRPDEEVSIESLGKVSELYRILENAITTGEKVVAKIEILGKVTSEALLMPDEQPDPIAMGIAQVVNDAWKLSRRFGFPSDASVTVVQLMSQKEFLRLVSRVIFDEAVHARFQGTVEQLDRELPICVPFVTCVMIGEYSLRIAASVWVDLVDLGFAEEDGTTRIEGTASDVRLEKSDLFLSKDRTPLGASELLDEIFQEYTDKATCLIMPRQVLGCD